MSIFDGNMPYTNLHELNNDWIVKTVKEVKDKTELIDDSVEQAKQSEENAKTSEEQAKFYADSISDVFITPEMFGAVGDGVSDDTTAIQTACDYCRNNNKELFFKAGNKYKITSSINMRGVPHIEALGKLQNGTNEIIIGTNNLIGKPEVIHLNEVNGQVRMIGGANATVIIDYADKLTLFADGDDANGYYIGYCSFYLGYINTLEINSASGTRTCWINDNKFFGGHFINITIDGELNSPNNNTFYGSKIEGETININKGYSNIFYDIRSESTVAINFGVNTFNNILEFSWNQYPYGVNLDTFTLPTTVMHKVTDNGKNNFVMSSFDKFTRKELIHSITPSSNNYDVSLITKNANSVTLQQNKTIFETEMIHVTQPFSIYFESDQSDFRIYTYCYDENGNAITTQPSSDAIYVPNTSWSTNGYFSNSTGAGKRDSNQGAVCVQPGQGVGYIKIAIRTVNYTLDSWDIKYFNMYKLENKRYRTNIGIPYKYKHYSSPSVPTSGTWLDGDVVYNSVPTANAPIGWVYINNSWHDFGTIS